MDITPLFPTPVASSSANSTATDTTKVANTFDDFLTLLTTQLTNQDPLSPMEPSEFTNQLVQFSIVEQEIKSNDTLNKLIDLSETDRALNVSNMLGATVEAAGDFAALTDGEVRYGYTLARDAGISIVRIFDENGALVRSEPGETDAGAHTFVWDGLDDDGDAVPAGQYRIAVSAADTDGAIDVPTTVVGQVTGMHMDGENLVLSLNGTDVGLDKIISLRQTPPVSGG